MSRSAGAILKALSDTLSRLPDVTSTAQWGGRAYKLPRGGTSSKPKILAHVSQARDGGCVTVSFKLEKRRAEALVDRHAWLEQHPFGSLGRAGWVHASVRTKRQVDTLLKLLAESHALQKPKKSPAADLPEPATTRSSSDPTARRIARIVTQARAEGWEPDADASFD
jgi:predicted DNA-binding protein (MmcQ/YjbR family)